MTVRQWCVLGWSVTCYTGIVLNIETPVFSDAHNDPHVVYRPLGENVPWRCCHRNHDDVIKWKNFPVTGPLWGESTGHWWIPLRKASDSELWCFLWGAPEQTVEQTVEILAIWGAIALTMMYMIASSNWDIICVIGHLCVEFTGHRWISLSKASDDELWCFLWSAPIKQYTVE